jgi:hypothetical protein
MAKPKNPLHYGVAVGINRYPDIRHLKRAKGDAEEFCQVVDRSRWWWSIP